MKTIAYPTERVVSETPVISGWNALLMRYSGGFLGRRVVWSASISKPAQEDQPIESLYVEDFNTKREALAYLELKSAVMRGAE